MSSAYAGTPVYPVDFLIPDDADPPTASAFNIAAEALGDRTAYLKALADSSKCVPVITEFLASGSIAIPADALPWVIYEGCGGGGAGGKGGLACGSGNLNSGGGGGGGAIKKMGLCAVVPGESYGVVIGIGGVGVDGFFGVGIAGDDTTFTRTTTSTVLLRCRGASGGHSGGGIGGAGAIASNGEFHVARGGRPVRITVGAVLIDPFAEDCKFPTMHFDRTPQSGGLGTCSTWPIISTSGPQGTIGMAGADSPEGFAGGAPGAPGTHGGFAYYGGGAGGGGGAGPYGNGAHGGDGSDGNPSVSSSAPSVGASASANSGAGGGGGGGAGDCSLHDTLGASPGNGGSGRLRVIYFRKMVP